MASTMTLDEGDRSGPVAAFAPGTSIAQFRIVGELGRGGMGIVLEAHDPDLDRRVAIKVVREGSSSRLVREAQAMARLAHPNVVTVYEVGELAADQMFVVMELVNGTTLAEWLKTPRAWREIVIAFAAAADGLDAAHRAGLVHRDFKPSNVLVDRDGRVRVSDFGLAHPEEKLAEGSEPIAGTLAYMAPEQRAGRIVDARADQYSFGIALQDALAGKKPPRRVQKAVARALSIDPDDRFAAMPLLANELRAALPRRRVAMIGGGVIAAGIAAFLIVDPARGAVVSCADGAELVEQVWNPAARTLQLARFRALAPRAQLEVGHALGTVDDWAQTWKLGRRAACSVDEPQRTARVGCLDRQLLALRAQLGVWTNADAVVAERAATTAAQLPDVEACALESTATPIHPAVVQKVAQIDALVHSGKMTAALAEVDGLLVIARASGHPRDLATALIAAGKAEHENGRFSAAAQHFTQAAQEAGKARDDLQLVDALIREASTKVEAGTPFDALGLLDAATAVGLRAGDSTITTRIAFTRGNAQFESGQLQESIATFRAILPIVEARAARDPNERLSLSTLLGQLAGALREADDPEAAVELLRRCVALDEQTFGPDHPEVAKSLADLSSSEAHLSRFADAHAHLARAKTIIAAAYGTDALLAAKIELAEGNLFERESRNDEALAAFRAASEKLAMLPPDHSLNILVETGIGEGLQRADHCDEALPHIQHALALLERSRVDPRQHALQMIELGHCYSETHQDDKARETLLRALIEVDDTKLADRWKVEPLVILAEIEHDAGHKAKALAYARDALAAAAGDKTEEMKPLRDYATNQLAQWR